MSTILVNDIFRKFFKKLDSAAINLYVTRFTLLGVLIGCCSIVIMVSIGIGMGQSTGTVSYLAPNDIVTTTGETRTSTA